MKLSRTSCQNSSRLPIARTANGLEAKHCLRGSEMLRRFCLEREVPHRSWKLNSVEGGIVGDHCRFQVVYLAIQDRFSWQFRIFFFTWRPLAATGGHCRPLVLHQGICGKLIVATSEAQLPELKALEMKALSSAHGEIGEGTTTPQSQGIYCSKR